MFLCRFYHFLEALTCRINALHNPLIIIIGSVLPALLFTLFAFEVVFRGHGGPFFRFPELCSWHLIFSEQLKNGETSSLFIHLP